MNKAVISLIVVNYNGLALTKKCVASIYENTGIDFEVIVVDNGSTDSGAEELREGFGNRENFKVIELAENMLLAPAYNIGAQRAGGDTLVFMNNDLTFSANWLRELNWTLEQSNVGLAGPAILSAQDTNKICNLGGQMNLFGIGSGVESGKDYQPRQRVREVFFAPGAILAAKRRVFEKIGGFDDDFGINYEDSDISWRARLLGYKVATAEKAVVYHLDSSPTIRKFIGNTNSGFLCRRNRLAMLIKNAGPVFLTLILPIYLVTHIFSSLKELVIDKNPKMAATHPRAFFWVAKHLRQIFKKRRRIQKTRRVSDLKIVTAILKLRGT